MKMQASEIAAVLEQIAALMEIKGENPFRCRAYYNAARVVEGLTDLEIRIKEKTLIELKGIGEDLAEQIAQLALKGQSERLNQLRKSFPRGILDMLRVPGLGPRKVKILHAELGINNLGELEYACVENRLLDLKGFGEKTQVNVLKGIELLKKTAGRFLLDVALHEALPIHAFVQKQKGVIRCEIAGSLRRRKETIGDIDILASLKGPADALMKTFCNYPQAEVVLAQGETKSSVRLKTGIQVDLRVVTDQEFPFALLYFTGSKEHNTVLRQMAKARGLKLNEYGLFKGKKSIPCKTEADIYQALGLNFIPPELRENQGEFQFAAKRKYPPLIEEKDLRGTFHAHSTWSDGTAEILEMGKAAEKLGFEYLGLSDHSQSAGYAGGLKPKELVDQAKEISRANGILKKCVILQGTESDILADGSLDYPEATLNKLDFVIASLHSGFKMDRERMTRRILKAMENPHTRFIGHISTRLLLAREGVELDYPAIFAAAAKRGVVIEINANPHRLDLDWRYLAQAKEMGVKFAINPDAHSTAGLADTPFGVGIARKGGLTAEDVINTRSLKEIREFCSKGTPRV
jgi:DNA polymerase (family 10)